MTDRTKYFKTRRDSRKSQAAKSWGVSESEITEVREAVPQWLKPVVVEFINQAKKLAEEKNEM